MVVLTDRFERALAVVTVIVAVELVTEPTLFEAMTEYVPELVEETDVRLKVGSTAPEMVTPFFNH
jgi:hypothetical protein